MVEILGSDLTVDSGASSVSAVFVRVLKVERGLSCSENLCVPGMTPRSMPAVQLSSSTVTDAQLCILGCLTVATVLVR